MSEQAQALVNALATRFGFELRTHDIRENQFRFLGKVPPEFSRNWIVGVHHLLKKSLHTEWTLDISRQYFLRGDALVWGWRLIFQHSDINSQAPDIITAIGAAPRAKFEVTEQRLPGVKGPRRTMNARGKGASPAGTPPMLIQSIAARGR
jgi:hypothetical protein